MDNKPETNMNINSGEPLNKKRRTYNECKFR